MERGKLILIVGKDGFEYTTQPGIISYVRKGY